MSDESYSFSTARVRLEEIVTQVRKKDTSLEKSLDLLEEGVRLANACTELIDHADWSVGGVAEQNTDEPAVGESDEVASAVEERVSDDAEFAADDDAFGDAVDEAWADDTPEYRDDEA